MDRTALTRMQIRVVLTVFRAELARLRRLGGGARGTDAAERLRERSLLLLDEARAQLDGAAPDNPRLLDEITEARSEVERTRLEDGEQERDLAMAGGSSSDSHSR